MSYTHIMLPIDLEHADRMGKAIETALALAVQFGAKLTLVGVTSELPGVSAHNPTEFKEKLSALAQRLGEGLPQSAESRTYVAHDPSVQIDGILLDAIKDVGADLVVMASHIPNVLNAIWPSHGGKMASHADVSVFVVR
ncbi:universal stress protein [Sedimentimonas flavescens]|uniref:universal stress protein n=1 Tax=Sedimentimonas flavescens TaxID=2851012 RepID=UPI001C4A02B9|nr:universal stress protein [Sedimentimonas flavescens]MBW0159562.1 universal stress protein [Sedimentimonas flavescens]